ncbi:hypothetical protein [Luteibaculum oceani]|uniref:DUF1735 domain-containing protein n=1 Tax=Luteibaculum oceani TaxID=1294296 RepID=A0A5C6V2M7_9FLAO|nr:hypothetical protein [Luteibaculum oceani]TXC78891.1 hypothetical protein FRX97_06665 [Luteibaculum oceani]
MKFRVVFAVLASCMFLACLKNTDLPPEPVISEVRTVVFTDSARFTIVFTDGDGDIGLNPGDTFPPFDKASYFHSNLYFNYFEFRNGAWKRVYLNIDPQTGDTINPFAYRIPVLETDGRDKTLEGEINVDLPFALGSGNADTVRFEVELYDRALNVGKATTEAIILN